MVAWEGWDYQAHKRIAIFFFFCDTAFLLRWRGSHAHAWIVGHREVSMRDSVFVGYGL
jgi:hypothetical protein